MTKGERKKLKEVAYHEAGHAVAAFLMRRRFKKVSIIPEGNALGCLDGCGWRSKQNPEYDDVARLRNRIEGQIIISLAGPVAEANLGDKIFFVLSSSQLI
jgi:ATP-dependent Zn protease